MTYSMQITFLREYCSQRHQLRSTVRYSRQQLLLPLSTLQLYQTYQLVIEQLLFRVEKQMQRALLLEQQSTLQLIVQRSCDYCRLSTLCYSLESYSEYSTLVESSRALTVLSTTTSLELASYLLATTRSTQYELFYIAASPQKTYHQYQ